jgi:hypothetical protein
MNIVSNCNNVSYAENEIRLQFNISDRALLSEDNGLTP